MASSSSSKGVAAAAAAAAAAVADDLPHFIDIGVNLSDSMFRGVYNGKTAHPDDLQRVLARARNAGVVKQIVTGGSLAESKEALEICEGEEDLLCTIGCHPTRSTEFDKHEEGPEAYLQALSQLIKEHSIVTQGKGKGKGKAVAVGECGLDYDRLHFCPADVQKKYFDWQLSLAVKHRLPLFLHSRAAAADFISILQPRMTELSSALSEGASAPPALPAHLAASESSSSITEALRVGVVHSFTGSLEEMQELVSLGLFIGVNGCSLKTEENLAVVKAIPLSRLMLETDAPWCDLRPTHASAKHVAAALDGPVGERFKALYSPPTVKKEKYDPERMVKGRNEPCAIGQVAAVVAGVKGLEIAEVAGIAERNTRWLFGL
ncbi:hypothetical protein BCV69DRAFT_264867 [Microstroma glucosiphilum]|uniref:Mg-dependent DNase n=1 Tax=Pseudomicrostroma glucosiphilum TaxID=1684307 RepID=A0A316UEK6_9BASI|nr:hypothetical protein BCV69DRAFT_264867 [Pseudomicrostroma glucosiphilum]PWN23650.1 hypothetical protein BCV69DRAFT_264867 [Pseudomicrostroma glucosiphilum]